MMKCQKCGIELQAKLMRFRGHNVDGSTFIIERVWYLCKICSGYLTSEE